LAIRTGSRRNPPDILAQLNADRYLIAFSGKVSVCANNIKQCLFSADFEHLGATSRAYTLGSRTAVLHGDGLGVLHFLLGAALYTITLHLNPPQ
jgi:hypothetical protein